MKNVPVLPKVLFKGQVLNLNSLCNDVEVDEDEFNRLPNMCFFDKKRSIVYEQLRFQSPLKRMVIKTFKNRFIPLPQIIGDSRYTELVKELDEAWVTDFFGNAPNDEDAYFRYRVFIEYFDLIEHEELSFEALCLNALISWCEENKIPFRIERKTEILPLADDVKLNIRKDKAAFLEYFESEYKYFLQ